MADQRRSGRGKGGIPHHPLVEALASDPNQSPQPATRLFGYPGPAADSKSTRLWLDLDLTSYVDVPNEAIVHHQTLENDQGTILWVEPSATLSHATTQSQEVEAEFLGGPISQAHLAAAAPPAVGGFGGLNWGGGRLQTLGIACPGPNSFAWSPCPPTDLVPCRVSANIPCTTRDVGCQPVSIGCPSRAFCPPSRDFRCPTDWHCQTEICADTPLCGDPVVNPGGDPVGPIRPLGRFR